MADNTVHKKEKREGQEKERQDLGDGAKHLEFWRDMSNLHSLRAVTCSNMIPGIFLVN